MTEVTNLDNKRVCDISADSTVIEIRRKGCVTIITANPDGTLNVTQERANPAA
jgi:Ethanolamine utilization protein EutJ (predicted chaperonin)